MISRLIRYIITLLCLAVAVMVVTNRGGYTSLIPDNFNPLRSLKSPKDSVAIEPSVVEVDSLSCDSLMSDSLLVDSLQRDSIKQDTIKRDTVVKHSVVEQAAE